MQQPTLRELSRWLIGIARPVLAPLGWSTLARIINQTLGIVLYVVPVYALVTMAQEGARGATIGWVALIMVAVALTKAFLRYLEHYLGHWVAFQALELIRIRVFRDIFPQAPALVNRVGKEAVGSGDMLARLTRDIGHIEVFFAHTLAPVISAVVVPVGLVVVAAFLSPWQALVWLGILVLVALVSLNRSAYTEALAVGTARGAVSQHVADSIGGVAEVVGFQAQERRLAELSRLEAPLTRAATRKGVVNGARLGFVAGLRMATMGLMLLPLLLGASVPLPVGVALMIAAVRCWDMVSEVADLGSQLSQSFAAAHRVWSLSHAGLELESGPESIAPMGAGLPVEFAGVTFAYPGASQPSVEDVTLTAGAGLWTAVVGTTGSGKSTLARLLLRWWDVEQGEVRLGGRSVREYDLEQLRAAVGIVTQDIRLMHASVADNLRLAAPAASDEALRHALHIACLDEELTDLDMVVGEGGAALSGGQRQRLSLAQALLRGGRVLILDEFTAHLNPELAATVHARLRAAYPDTTVLEITHVLDTIESADWVAVMDRGRIVEQGAPVQLAQRGGAFAHLLTRDGTR